MRLALAMATERLFDSGRLLLKRLITRLPRRTAQLQSISMMLPLAAKHLNLALIEAGAQIENASSFAVLARCGMVRGGERLVYASARARNKLCRFHEWVPPT